MRFRDSRSEGGELERRAIDPAKFQVTWTRRLVRSTIQSLDPMESNMAYAIVHHFPGGTKKQYEKSLEVLHPGDGLPAGQLFHAAGPAPGGWTIMAVHDSKESWEQFRDHILMPRIKQGIEGGLVGPPQETAFELHKLQM